MDEPLPPNCTDAQLTLDGDKIVVDLVTEAGTLSFWIDPPGASALASDLDLMAESARIILSPPVGGKQSIYAPKVQLEDFGESKETGDVYLAFRFPEGLVHRFRLKQSEFVRLAQTLLPILLKTGEGPSHKAA